MVTTLIVPGLHDSGPEHWQTWLEARIPGSIRVTQRDWATPNLPEWSRRVRHAISASPGAVVLVAHSFGALAAVQAAADHEHRVAGAMLVAPVDPHGFRVADVLPKEPLSFPSLVVASSDDPWMRIDRAAHWADLWGSDFVSLGRAGHINAEANFGAWPEGLALYRRLRRRAANDGSHLWLGPRLQALWAPRNRISTR
jgi:serine hydrolase